MSAERWPRTSTNDLERWDKAGMLSEVAKDLLDERHLSADLRNEGMRWKDRSEAAESRMERFREAAQQALLALDSGAGFWDDSVIDNDMRHAAIDTLRSLLEPPGPSGDPPAEAVASRSAPSVEGATGAASATGKNAEGEG